MMTYLALFFVVMIGGGFAFFNKNKDSHFIKLLLSFSGAYLLSIIVFHLLPEVYKDGDRSVGLFIMLGIIFQLLLELFSHGAEHGHQHLFDKTPWLLFVSISIHAFMEGLPIHQGHHLHSSYLYGILIHKLPISIVLSTFLLKSGIKKSNIVIFLLFFASMTPLAAYLGEHVDFLTEYSSYINAFVVGILAHIGTNILFENEHSHEFNLRKFILIFVALGIAYLS